MIWKNSNRYIFIIWSLFFMSCQFSSKTVVNKQRIALESFPDSIVAFTFNPSQELNMRIYKDGIDPLKLLRKKFIHDNEFNIDTLVQFNKEVFKEFYDSAAIFSDFKNEHSPTDCGFYPHHCIIYLDKNNVVFSYELICYKCANRRSYGKKLKKYGSLQTYFKFFQFHGLSNFFGLEALHHFGTQAEIDCQRLRTFPGEVLKCD